MDRLDKSVASVDADTDVAPHSSCLEEGHAGEPGDIFHNNEFIQRLETGSSLRIDDIFEVFDREPGLLDHYASLGESIITNEDMKTALDDPEFQSNEESVRYVLHAMFPRLDTGEDSLALVARVLKGESTEQILKDMCSWTCSQPPDNNDEHSHNNNSKDCS